MKFFEQESPFQPQTGDENKPITPPVSGLSALKDLRPSDEDELTQYDKELADSFPASDPPTQP